VEIGTMGDSLGIFFRMARAYAMALNIR